MKVPGPGVLAALTAVAALASGAVAHGVFASRPRWTATEAEAKALLQGIRAGACRGGAPPAAPQGPAVLTAWNSGQQALGSQAEGELTPLTRSLARSGLCEDDDVRLQLDLAQGTGWVPQRGLLLELALVEGHDGVSAEVAGQRVWVPPGDLVHRGAIGSVAPLGKLEPGLRVRIDTVQHAISGMARALPLMD